MTARATAHWLHESIPQNSIPKLPSTAWHIKGNSPLPAAGSPSVDRQMDRGMDGRLGGSPQPCPQSQPLQVLATASRLAERSE